jgi:hypothetical protein
VGVCQYPKHCVFSERINWSSVDVMSGICRRARLAPGSLAGLPCLPGRAAASCRCAWLTPRFRQPTSFRRRADPHLGFWHEDIGLSLGHFRHDGCPVLAQSVCIAPEFAPSVIPGLPFTSALVPRSSLNSTSPYFCLKRWIFRVKLIAS